MRQVIATILLVSGFYAHANAQNYDYALPDGSVVHRRVFVYPQCVGSNMQDKQNWVHDGPCDFNDIGWIDEHRKFHWVKQPTNSQQRRTVLKALADAGWVDS